MTDMAIPGTPLDDNGRTYPLMLSQLGMRDGQLAEPESTAYTTAMVVWFHDTRDVETVKAAVVRSCGEASAVTVTLKVDQEGAWTQTVDSDIAKDIRVHDFSDHDDPQRNFSEWLGRAASTPFELVGAPLLRQAVVLVGDRIAYVAFAHHMVIDGYGAALLQRRLAAVYVALASNREIPSLQFGSLGELVNAVRTPQPDDLEYWVRYLQHMPAVLSFSPEIAAPAPAPIVRQTIVAGVRRHGQTWTRLMIAAIAAYVARHTGMVEAVVGVPVSNRRSHIERRTPAMLMTVLPLRVDVPPSASTREVARQVGSSMNDLSRRTLQRSEVLRQAIPSVWRSGRLHGPIANIVPFELDRPDKDAPCTVQILNHGPVEDFSIVVAPTGDDSVRVELCANPRIYGEGEIDDHLKRIERWVHAVADDPDRPIDDLPFLTTAETAAHERIGQHAGDVADVSWDGPTTPASLAGCARAETDIVGVRLLDGAGRPVPFSRLGLVHLMHTHGSEPIPTDVVAAIETDGLHYRGMRSDLRFVRGRSLEMGRYATQARHIPGVVAVTVDADPERARLLVDVDASTVQVDDIRETLTRLMPAGVRIRVKTI